MVKPYTRLHTQGHLQMAYRCGMFDAYCLLSCREQAMLIFCLCRSTVTLHQGQVHRNEHEHIYGTYKYKVMLSVNEIAEHIVRCIARLLDEGQGKYN